MAFGSYKSILHRRIFFSFRPLFITIRSRTAPAYQSIAWVKKESRRGRFGKSGDKVKRMGFIIEESFKVEAVVCGL